ncbi:hypothetical protein [Novosphingobium aerophilum]|uniref:hypothetical protein n=1 Tax=Novosphingobium aerophilum TaxID=2839843 RepID=UPI003FCF71D9
MIDPPRRGLLGAALSFQIILSCSKVDLPIKFSKFGGGFAPITASGRPVDFPNS